MSENHTNRLRNSALIFIILGLFFIYCNIIKLRFKKFFFEQMASGTKKLNDLLFSDFKKIQHI